MKRKALTTGLSACAFCLATALPAGYSQGIPEDRPYEPIVFPVSSTPLPQDDTVPISEFALFRYDAMLQQWIAVPFQIDEVDASGSFFQGTDGLVDGFDQIVFMSRDLGDRAPDNRWIDDPEARINPRYEIRVLDPISSLNGYAYLYRSSTLDKSGVPKYMRYAAGPDGVPAADSVGGLSYLQGHTPKHGLPDYLLISDAPGNGPQAANGVAVDLLDRLKIRLNGRVFIFNIALTEDDLNAEAPVAITGPVRVLRQVEEKVSMLGTTVSLNVLLKFYPYSAVLSGDIPTAGFDVSLFRFSLDLSPGANGYAFYNHANSKKIIDASPEPAFDTGVLTGNRINWDISAGADGKVVKLIQLDLSQVSNAAVSYYYRDAPSGTNDGTAETGDGKSYGDSGMRFDRSGGDISGTLKIAVQTYYLPAGVGTQDSLLGAQLAGQAELPLLINNVDTQIPDLIPPARITDLGVVQKTETSMTLAWTAPGDDGMSGRASSYILYYDSTPVGTDTVSWIQTAVQETNLPAPADPNTMQQYSVTGLQMGQQYFFILVTLDDFGNQSAFSNVATEITVPVELAVFNAQVEGNTVELAWQTVSESNNAGFAIERRAEAEEETWQQIAFINGTGTSNEPRYYTYSDRVTTPGVYFYRLRQIDFDGSSTLSHPIRVEILIPLRVELAQSYPNPLRFGGTSVISYTLPSRSSDRVRIRIYNVLGQDLGTLFQGEQPAGYYRLNWDGRLASGVRVPAGIYFIVLETAGSRAVKKIAIIP